MLISAPSIPCRAAKSRVTFPTMITTSGLLTQFPSDTARALADYRHRIFVQRLGWHLPCLDGREFDQFDRPDTVYTLALDASGAILGCARMLPTTKPYLLGELFPELLDGAPPPRSARIWELSRFACSSPSATRPLLAATIASAARAGATRLLTISPLGVERLMRRMGVQMRRAGAPIRMHGKQVLACWIDIDAQTRSSLEIGRSATLRAERSPACVGTHEGEHYDA